MQRDLSRNEVPSSPQCGRLAPLPQCHWSRDTVIIGATAQMKTQEIDRIQFYSESSDNPTGKARKK
jgi:hypothetical protein